MSFYNLGLGSVGMFAEFARYRKGEEGSEPTHIEETLPFHSIDDDMIEVAIAGVVEKENVLVACVLNRMGAIVPVVDIPEFTRIVYRKSSDGIVDDDWGDDLDDE